MRPVKNSIITQPEEYKIRGRCITATEIITLQNNARRYTLTPRHDWEYWMTLPSYCGRRVQR
jgi:hypothetical protein